jgi:hypothetical protein
MADSNPTDCERDPASPAEADRKTERAVLAFLLDEHPRELTIPEVSRAFNPKATDSGGDEVERAILELVGARLLHCREGFVMPTRAALYFERLQAD